MAGESVLVIGGGIAGPAVALFLSRQGLRPTVFEASESATDIGGGLQVAPNGMQVLRELGLSEAVLRCGVESNEFSFENESGKVLGRIPNGPASRYGLPSVQLRRCALHELLLEELRRKGIAVQYSKKLVNVVELEDGVEAQFADGSSAQGAVLVGADGIHSRTRRVVFPEAPGPSYTGLITIGGFARSPALAARSDEEQTRTHMIFGRNGFFGYGYYRPDDASAVMWWSHQQRAEEPSREETVGATSEMLRAQAIAHHREWAEPVQSILQSTERVLWGPVDDVPPLERWSRGRVVLIGDVAHAISPHAGQGVSLALEDAITLAQQMGQSAYAEAFARYESARKARVEKIAAEARKRGEAKHDLPRGAAKVRDFMLAGFLRLRGKRMFEETYRFAVGGE